MDPNYARHYSTLFERHWWWRAREELILRKLEELRPAKNWETILDVGCGDGLFFERLQSFGSVEGIEMDPTGVNVESRWAKRIYMQPFDSAFQPANDYGLILMLDVVEHFSDPVPCLRRAVELLRPHGRILITVPAFPSLWTSHDTLNHHHRRYTRRSLAEVLKAANALLLEAFYFFQWTTPLKLAVHLKEKVLPSSPAIPRVPPGWLNSSLYRLSIAEQRLLKHVPVPFGSSLFAIAGRPDEAVGNSGRRMPDRCG